jgi:hypothetical protein
MLWCLGTAVNSKASDFMATELRHAASSEGGEAVMLLKQQRQQERNEACV